MTCVGLFVRAKRRRYLTLAARVCVLSVAITLLTKMAQHLPEWVGDLTDPLEARRLFERYYLPHLRVVTVPATGLSPDEEARVVALRASGSKDWPTATLALLLNAPVLSRDKRLLRTVYGPDADVDALANWLGLALDGRVMGETDVQSWAMTGAGELAIRGGFAAGEALLRLFLRLPLHIQLLILGAAIGGAVLARKALTNAARATGETAKEFLKETIWPAIATMLAEREFAA